MTPIWIFDLDNTLHHANPQVFPHINRAMTRYLQTELGLDEAAANQLRLDYWQRYGATLTGLMHNHGTDPEHFLWHTHQFPELRRMLLADGMLRHTLRRLPGRKLLFTNGPQHYATAVLAELGIADLFCDVIAIQTVAYRPKPDPHGYRYILRRHGLRPAQCVMIEDSAINLVTAKRLGMRTVWLTREHGLPPYVDWRIARLGELTRIVGQLR